MKRFIILMVLLVSIMQSIFANETALSITQKLPNSSGEATTSVGDITFLFTGSGTSYQNAYVKMVPASGLTVSTSTGTISKIVLTYADGRTKSKDLTFTTNPSQTWDATSSTWTGSASSVTLTCGGDGECSISGVTVTYTPTKSLTFTNNQVAADLTTLGQSVQKPTNATGTVTYTSSNAHLAQIDTNGWIRFVNTGIVTISAKDANGATGSYTLAINATEAQSTVNGNTWTVSGTGKISNKNVASVPYIKMQIGNANEASMVRAGDNNYLAITNLDTNGFSHAFVDSNTGLPTMGTYYAFTPTVSGTLTVTGAFDSNGGGKNGAQLYEGKNSVGSIAFVSNFAEATGTFNLKANTTYYLYVPTVGGNYDYFCLHSFSFKSDYYFETKKYIASSSETTFTQTVKGGSSSTYTAKAYGDLRHVSVDNNGKVSWSGNGGAIVVTAKDKTTSDADDGSSDSYVITVPYATHEWNFRDDNISYTKMTASTSDWDVTYKVRRYEKRVLTYLNAPVMANGTALDGTNALYFPATAGLLINSDADGMGSNITGWKNDVNYDGMTLNEQLALNYTQANTVGLLTLYKNSTLTIPNLKKGQYVRIKWNRYASYKGDHITAKNVTDLNGKEISSSFNIGRPIPIHDYDYGYEFFIVKADGDISFTPTDDGWIDIYNITVADQMPATDMRLVEIGKETASEKFANPLTYTNNTTVSYSQVPATLHIVTCMSNGKEGTQGTVKYTAACKEGNITFTMSEDGKLDVTGGQGILTITQEGINSNYTLDRKVTEVTIYEKKTVSKAYPFTWDLANSKTTADDFKGDQWKKNSDGSLSLNAKSWDYYGGNDLQTGNGDCNETADLGIDVPRDKDNSLTVKPKQGLAFGSNDSQVLTIPSVQTGYKAYILATIGTDGSIAQNGTTLTGSPYYKDNSKRIFVIDGAGADINLTVKNATIEKIGVTGTFKEFNTYNGKSYATEYRDHNERYDLTTIFTNGQAPVTAEYIASVDNDNHLAKTTPISVAPAKTGVLLTCTATERVNAVPLFVKDVNTTEDTPTDNLLKGSLTETSTLASGTNYIFTRVSYHLDKDGKIADDAKGKESTLGFYRVATNDDSSLPANKAYLNIADASGAKSFYVIEGLFNDGTTTDITAIDTTNRPQDGQGAYYTLTGSRLNGRPSRPGIYVHNGKKVIIK